MKAYSKEGLTKVVTGNDTFLLCSRTVLAASSACRFRCIDRARMLLQSSRDAEYLPEGCPQSIISRTDDVLIGTCCGTSRTDSTSVLTRGLEGGRTTLQRGTGEIKGGKGNENKNET